MIIRVGFRDGSSSCLYVTYWEDEPLNIHDGCYDYDKQYMWIYTKNKQLISLDRFDCLTLGSNNKVTVSPCKASSKNQRWYCDGNGTLHNEGGVGSPEYTSEYKFRLNTDAKPQKWKSYTEGSGRGNVCQWRPVEYKGTLFS